MSESLFAAFDAPVPEPVPETRPEPENPCLALYGPCAVEGQTCKDCVHLRYPVRRNPAQKFWKCDLRRLTHGRSSDHRVSWPACGRYERREGEYFGG